MSVGHHLDPNTVAKAAKAERSRLAGGPPKATARAFRGASVPSSTGDLLGSFYNWSFPASTTTPSNLTEIYPKVAVNGAGDVAYFASTVSAGQDDLYDDVYETSCLQNGQLQPLDLGINRGPAQVLSPGVSMNDAGQVVATFDETTYGQNANATDDHLRVMQCDRAPIDVANAGAVNVPPFSSVDDMPAINDDGEVAFTARANAQPVPGVEGVFTPVQPTGGGMSLTAEPPPDYNYATPSLMDGPAAVAIDSAGGVLVPVTASSGSVADLDLYPNGLPLPSSPPSSSSPPTPLVIASTRPGFAICGDKWVALGARPSVSADGTAVAFAGQLSDPDNPSKTYPAGIYICYKVKSGAWVGAPLNVASDLGIADLALGTAPNLSLWIDEGDLNSSVTVVSGVGAAASRVLVGFVAQPNCGNPNGPFIACDQHELAGQAFNPNRGVWGAEVSLPSSAYGHPIVESVWPIAQVGDDAQGEEISNLDATASPGENDPAVWFSMASGDGPGSPSSSGPQSTYVALAAEVSQDGQREGTTVLLGRHTLTYVALGDSYSSGEGDGGYIPSTNVAGDICHRSVRGYAELVAAALGISPSSFTGAPGSSSPFAACSGAEIGDFYSTNKVNPAEPAQQAHLLPHAPDVVTITLGGNDAGFGAVVEKCMLRAIWVKVQGSVGYRTAITGKLGTTAQKVAVALAPLANQLGLNEPCEDWYNSQAEAGKYNSQEIVTELGAVYEDILAKAPQATVLVLGYPNFFEDETVKAVSETSENTC
ncbi:MAG TPA: SGNH/GDSL hydrolase family protein, partial [Acidimicrobiales bacterium]|nr:SGNH/GDSL hydrolase family protein [Acidimicrobiales bacterium]